MNTVSLTLTDFAAMAPLCIVLVGALLVLLLESFSVKNSTRFSFYLTTLTFVAAIFSTANAPASTSTLLTPWLRFDSFSYFFILFFLIIGIGSAFLAHAFFEKFEASRGEYYFFLLSTIFGLMLIAQAADFLTLFLGLETLSISLYIMCGYIKKWTNSNEASMKYFLMGSIATAFFLYGIALVYGAIGTTNFNSMLEGYKSLQSNSEQILFLSGIILVTIGLGFKAAVVPFHVWAPDAYAGAPTPVTAFMAIGTKAGAFAAFARVFLIALPQFDTTWNELISLLAYPTLIYANFVAIRQVNLRRFFAYSGISHAGFLLIPLAAGTPDALSALMFYLVVYALATFGAFAVLAFLDQGSAGVMIEDLRGLFRRSPLLTAILALCLLTLAGIPPTAGFFAKFYVFKAAFEAKYYGLVIVGLLTTIVSAFYYLRFIAIMLSESPDREQPPAPLWTAMTVGVISSVAIIILSCYPSPLLEFFK